MGVEAPTGRLLRVGDEGQPVAIADALALNIEALRREAGVLRYRPVGAYYPGVRADAPQAVVHAVMRAADPQLRRAFAGDGRYAIVQAYFSLATTPPDRLSLPQRLPHYDGVEAERLAIMLYLGPPQFGGTSFYRHRATGFETIDRERLAPYLHALQQDFAREGTPGAGYVSAASPLFERIGQVAARPGRMVAYRGNLLHGADIPDASLLSDDPERGRLTLNIFAMLDARAAPTGVSV